MKWISWLWNPAEPKHFVFPIIYPGGGKLRDHHIWARTARDARVMVMACCATEAFLIGPGIEQAER